MKKILSAVAALAMAFTFTSCALDSPIEDNRPQIAILDDTGTLTEIDPRSYALKLRAQMVADCKSVDRANNSGRWNAIGELDSSTERLMAITGEQWKEALVAINGRETCVPGTNEYDAYIAYAEGQEKIYSMIIKETGSTLRFAVGSGFGYLAVDALSDAIGDKIGNQINGDENSIESSISTSKNENHKTQVGTSDSVIEGDAATSDGEPTGVTYGDDGTPMTDEDGNHIVGSSVTADGNCQNGTTKDDTGNCT